MIMIKAVFFDLDGTLLDTVHDIRKSVNDMLSRHGYPPISLEQAIAYIGDGAKQLIERSLPAGAEDLDACYAEFRTEFAKSSDELTRPFGGICEVLRELKAEGLRLCVVTNKPHEATGKLIERFFPGVFESWQGDSGLFPRKPDPTLALYTALTLRLAPGECAFIGDGETDVQTAKRAGMFGIAALWGYRTRAQLAAAGASVFAETPGDILKILKNQENFS